MTEAEFYTELAKLPSAGWSAELRSPTPFGFEKYDDRARFVTLAAPPSIPSEGDEEGRCLCPITAVCWVIHGSFYCPSDYWPAGMLLGLSEEFVPRVMRAADGLPDHDPATRAELLRALDLVEAPREVA